MKKRASSLPVLVVVAVVALVLGSIGTAVAGPALTKNKVKAIATKVVKKQAPTLSVANAASLGGKPASAYPVAADLVAGSQFSAICDPNSVTFDNCTTLGVTLTRSSKLLLNSHTPFGDDSTDGATGMCRITLDGVVLPGTTTNVGIGGTTGGGSDLDNTGMGVTNVTAAVSAGAHSLVLQCNETSPDIDFNDLSLSALAIPTP